MIFIPETDGTQERCVQPRLVIWPLEYEHVVSHMHAVCRECGRRLKFIYLLFFFQKKGWNTHHMRDHVRLSRKILYRGTPVTSLAWSTRVSVEFVLFNSALFLSFSYVHLVARGIFRPPSMSSHNA